jgi:hypothetical protein
MTESAPPNRDQQLEQIVDDLGDSVSDERERENVPGKPSEREEEVARTEGSTEEPTA